MIKKESMFYEINNLKKFVERRLKQLEYDSTMFDAEFILKHIKENFFIEKEYKIK